jgi:hypothetical protein
MHDFQNIAHTAATRIFKYFKYILKNPLVELMPNSSPCFLSPTWFDKNGDKLNTGILIFSTKCPPGLGSRDFGITPLTAELEPKLAKAIETEIEPVLYEELLADAHSALFQVNYRRAVLELAMACEIAIKQTYFSASTAAGRAYEFMEDHQKVSMNITDYIDRVAEYALGDSFQKATSKSDFANIQHLFRGRNKIVHRGELTFRDDKGIIHPIDLRTLKAWWISVDRLLTWLNNKKAS